MKLLQSKEGKTEFSKCWLFGCIIFTILVTIASFVLSIFDKNPVSELAIAIVQVAWPTSGACFIGYNFQNSARAIAKRKEDIANGLADDNSDYGIGSYPYTDDCVSYQEPESQSIRVAKVRRINGRNRARKEDGTA